MQKSRRIIDSPFETQRWIIRIRSLRRSWKASFTRVRPRTLWTDRTELSVARIHVRTFQGLLPPVRMAERSKAPDSSESFPFTGGLGILVLVWGRGFKSHSWQTFSRSSFSSNQPPYAIFRLQKYFKYCLDESFDRFSYCKSECHHDFYILFSFLRNERIGRHDAITLFVKVLNYLPNFTTYRVLDGLLHFMAVEVMVDWLQHVLHKLSFKACLFFQLFCYSASI